MAVTAAVTSAIAAVAAATMTGISNYQQGKAFEAESKINMAQELEAQKQSQQEKALNSTQHYRAARHEIAAGLNLLGAAGNIGTSAESALRGSYFNLSEDLSALKYKYDAEAAAHGTAALNYKYNAKMAKKNRRMGVLASSLNITSAGARGVSGVYSAGGFGGGSGSKAGSTTYTGARTADGMYGAWS